MKRLILPFILALALGSTLILISLSLSADERAEAASIPAKQPLLTVDAPFISTGDGVWSWQHPLPQGHDLRGVSCPTTTTCFAAGDYGIILTTDDGGTGWQPQNSGTTEQLNSVSCSTPSICFVVGNNGLILATSNGGSSWAAQPSGTTAILSEITCPTPTICFVVGWGGVILATNDGGISWNAQSSGTGNHLYSISCPTTATCFVGSYSSILTTSNGGNTWSLQLPGVPADYRGINCPTVTTCFAVGNPGVIIRTSNGGATWSGPYPNTFGNLESISCPTPSHCFVVEASPGIGTRIRLTKNGGNTWVTQQIDGFPDVMYGLNCPIETTCFAVGINGIIYTTTDSGTTWSGPARLTNQPLNNILCPTASHCIAVGNTHDVLTTDDAGNTWLGRPLEPGEFLWDLSCPTSTTCYAAGEGRTIATTHNGGASWSVQTITAPQGFEGIACPTASTCIVVAYEGTIRATTNGGSSWSARFSGTTATLRDIGCSTTTTCFIVGSNGTILLTDNSGSSWTPLTSGTSQELGDINCPTATTCFAVGYNGTILNTTDSGATWTPQTSGTMQHLEGISCPTASVCFAVGRTGTILATIDGGLTWRSQNSGTNYSLSSVSCPATTTCFATGGGSVILVRDVKLLLSQTVAPTHLVNTGQTITYTLAVENRSDQNVTQATLFDPLPDELTLTGPVSLEPPGIGVITTNPALMVNNLTISSGQRITVSFPVLVSASLPYGTIITNTATITSVEFPAPQSATQAIVVNPLALTTQAQPEVVESGGTLTYTLTVTNSGNITLTTTITDVLPPQVTPSGTLTWGPVNLSPGQVWLQKIGVIVNENYTGSLTNLARATTLEGVAASSSQTVLVKNPVDLCPATIYSVNSGNWDNSATWNKNRVPNETDTVLIQPGHTLSDLAPLQVQALCNYGTLKSGVDQALRLEATGFISNYGSIFGSDGSSGSGDNCGQPGSTLELRSSPFYNKGAILAGAGGSGQKCGGSGGEVMVYGRNTTNHGIICAGQGGSVSGTAAGYAGKGGAAYIRGNTGGFGYLVNDGWLCGGDGGSGNPAAIQRQHGNDGGCLEVSAPPLYLSGGKHFAGLGGKGTGGGSDGEDGCVVIDPGEMTLSGPATRIRGGDITLFGGDNLRLDLSNLSAGAISATGKIILAVGTGGAIDLRGNDDSILYAGEGLVIASDVISLDGGLDLSDLASTPSIVSQGSQILYRLALTGPGQVTGLPGTSLSVPLTLLNNGPMPDTYHLSGASAAGWNLSGLPAAIAVDGLALKDMTLQLTLPMSSPSSSTDLITITAASQADPAQAAVVEVKILVMTTEEKNYLPIILKR